ncbi:camk protein kinase [Plasmopara halstedii]|uniref:non-specific serine/threonine protein kinase n=1 Tax=Plasmopara halstedii TaxID=4781 RepID=A0A0N7L6G3_PLAHL|nr:camk protein kinase [Plasmopara halstedii]CEG44195.1 camk protein kinase [Plasmopara halstedii]|eukprot:XP_024580564.1 camk protein kinase [Plasmopara halstedii]
MASVLFEPANAQQSRKLQYRNEAASLEQPRTLVHYQVLQTFGSGVQGKVKLGVDTTTHQRVALKIIDMAKLSRNTLLASQVIVIVLELAMGGELFDFMMYTGVFSENIARAYFQQLVSGLDACHAQGVYHRDIKPENLLLDENFTLKIADFGLSGLRKGINDAVTELYTQCGTRGYMSPEVLSCMPYEGEPADVWSAGVVLFIMLAGFPPFEIATHQDWWFRACAAQQYEAFWSAHCRSAKFSPGAISIMTRIFDDLRAELLSRKVLVEEEKRIERKAKLLVASKQDNQYQVEDFDPFKMDTERSVTITTDTGSATSEFDSTEAPSYPTASVALYTCFQSSRAALELQMRVEKVLAEHSAHFVVHKDRFKTKVTMSTETGDVGFTVRIFCLDNESGRCVVEFRRTGGACLKFQEVFKKLRNSFADLVSDNQNNFVIAVEEMKG